MIFEVDQTDLTVALNAAVYYLEGKHPIDELPDAQWYAVQTILTRVLGAFLEQVE